MDALSLSITRAAVGDPEVDALVDAHVARSRKYYPVTSCHSYGRAALDDLGVTLYVGRVGGEAVTVGGLLPMNDGMVEMKSVFTAAHARGKGYGLAMVRHLIAEAKAAGHAQFLLETGSDDASAAARKVYEKLGFSYCPPFGAYTEDPLSVFMAKLL